jgi:hypothetical protein
VDENNEKVDSGFFVVVDSPLDKDGIIDSDVSSAKGLTENDDCFGGNEDDSVGLVLVILSVGIVNSTSVVSEEAFSEDFVE